MRKKTAFIIIITVVALALVSAAGYAGFVTAEPKPQVIQAPQTVAVKTCDVDQSISAPGTLENTHTSNIEMPDDGKLDEIYVKPGDKVKTGQPLAKLAKSEETEDPASIAAAAAAADLEVLQAQDALDALYRNKSSKAAQLKVDLLDAQEALKTAESNRTGLDYPRASTTALEKAKGELAQAENFYKIATAYYQKRAALDIADPVRIAALEMLTGAKLQYDRARANLNWLLGKPDTSEYAKADAEVEIAKAKIVEAQAVIDRLQDGVDPIEEAQAKTRLAEALAKVEKNKQEEKDDKILAPFAGVVLDVPARIGETIHAGTVILTLSDPKALEVKATITEEDYPLLLPGMDVELYFDARTDVTVTGKVARIIPKRLAGDHPLYNIIISLDEVPDGLVEGMTSDAAITIATRKGVLCLPRAIVRASGGNKATVKVWNGAQTESRIIEIGLRGDAFVEIVSGLKENELVVAK